MTTNAALFVSLVLLAALSACSSQELNGAWATSFEPPETLTTERMHLEPLHPRHVDLDFAALMGSRAHLQQTLRWGDWPRVDFTVAENLEDLEMHWREFEGNEAYAYTVLSPDRSTCIGCIYINPVPDAYDEAKLSYWVIEPELATELDRHLLESLFGWFERDWPFRRMSLPTHADNERGHALSRSLGLTDDGVGGRDSSTMFVWSRAD